MILPSPVQRALRLGWSVLPVGLKKKPMLDGWKEFQERSATPTEVQSWLRTKRPHAWAVVTGQVSQVFALDFDGESGVNTMRLLGINPHVQTGSGGYHAYFRHPGHRIQTLNSKTKRELGNQYPGMDIRADGGYAVFAGRNEAGPYKWLREQEPDSIEVLSAEVRNFLGLDTPTKAFHPSQTAIARATSGNGPSGGGGHSPLQGLKEQDLVQRALGLAASEGRNNAGFWLCCQLRDRGATEGEADAAMRLYVARTPKTNTKGKVESYTTTDALASLREAYSHPKRDAPKNPLVTKRSAPRNPQGSGSIAVETNQHGRTRTRYCELREDGVYYCDEDKVPRWIAPPIAVAARSRDAQGEQCAMYLRFTNWEGHERHIFLQLGDFYGDKASAFLDPLTNAGFRPTRQPIDLGALKDYLLSQKPDRWLRSTSVTGWHGSSFVLPDVCIGPKSSEEVIFRSEGPVAHRYAVSGTLTEWRDHIGKKCSGNSRLVFAVSCGLGGAVLEIVQAEACGFHLRGLSSTGKTTALDVAGSVWGGNPQHGYKETWSATKNGLEARAALHNDALLCLDEIGQVSEQEVGEMVYALINGLSKNRMSKSITLRPATQHKLVLLSTGERALADVMRSAKKVAKGGQEARLVEIEADAGAVDDNGKSMGLFETLHNAENPAVFAQQLKLASRRYYGAAIRGWLEWLSNNRESAAEQLGAIRAAFVRDHYVEGASGEVQRVLSSIALMAAAGEVASLGITGWVPGEAIEAAGRIFDAWINLRGGTGARDVESGISAVRAFLQSQTSRFENLGEKNATPIRDRAGYKEREVDGWCHYIFPEVFRNEICRDLDPLKVAQEMAKRDYLRRSEASKAEESKAKRLTFRKRTPDGGKNTYFYAVGPEIFSGEKDE